MNVSDFIIAAEGLGDLLKNLSKKRLNVSKRMAKNVSKNPGRALDITANIAPAAASRNPKTALSSLPELTNFIILVKVYISENLYILCYINGTKNRQFIYICTITKQLFGTKIRKKLLI